MATRLASFMATPAKLGLVLGVKGSPAYLLFKSDNLLLYRQTLGRRKAASTRAISQVLFWGALAMAWNFYGREPSNI